MRRAHLLLPLALVVLSGCAATFGGESDDGPATSLEDEDPANPEEQDRPDRTPPVLEIDRPAPGAFVDAATQPDLELHGVVHDDGGEVRVNVGGVALTVDADGSFRQSFHAPTPGLHTFVVEATDAAGNVTAAMPSVLYGTFSDDPVAPALVTRLGREALDAAARVVSDRLGDVDLEALVRDQNPIAEGLWGTTTVESLQRGSIRVTLSPAPGRLDVSVRLNDVDVDLHNDAPGPWNQDGWARVDAAIVDGRAHPSIREDGGVQVGIDGIEVTLEGFDFDISGIEGESLVRDQLRDVVEGQLRGIVRDRVPGMVEDALAGLDPKWSADVFGVAASAAMSFESLVVDAGGVELEAGIAIDVPDGGLAPESPGSLRTEGAPPVLEADGVSVAVADDLANAVLHAAWRAGLLHRTAVLPSPGGGDALTVGMLALLAPALGDLAPPDAPVEATIDPRLPPVLALKENGEITASIGELNIALRAVVDGEPVALLDLVARLDARVAPSFTDAGHVSIKLVDWSIVAEPRDAPPGVPRGAAFAELLDSVVDMVAPAIAGTIADVPIPSIGGLSVQGPTVAPGGPEGDWMTLTATLE